MKIIIEGEPKEIAALVLELQERQGESQANENQFVCDSGIVLCAENVVED